MADVLIIGDAVYNPSGYGKAIRYLTWKLDEMGFEVVNATWNTLGTIYQRDRITITSMSKVDKLVDKFKPRYVIVMGAPFIQPISNMLDSPEWASLERKVKTIIYGVHEGVSISPLIDDYFARAHMVAVPALALAAYFEFDPDRVALLKHYVDTDVFYQVDEEILPRDVEENKWLVDLQERINESKRSFDIGFVATNHPRKRFDLVLYATMRLTQELRRVVSALLKTTENGFWNLRSIAGLFFKLYSTPFIWKVDDYLYEEYELPLLYRQMKVNFHATNGEAFAYPVIESLLSCTPAFVTDHPAMREIYGKWVEYIPASQTVMGNEGIGYLYPTLNDVDKVIDKLKEYVEHHEEKAEQTCKIRDEIAKKYDYRSKEHEQEIKNVLDLAEKQDRFIKTDTIFGTNFRVVK